MSRRINTLAIMLVLSCAVAFVPGATSSATPSGSVVGFERATFESVTPFRVWDSRTGPGPVGKVSAAVVNVTVAGAGSVPADATGVMMNVTVTEGTAASFVSVFPAGSSPTGTSNLNFAPGQTVPNLVTVRVGSAGSVAFANAAGSVDIVADVMGYFRPHDHDDRYYTKAQIDSTVSSLQTRVSALEAGQQGVLLDQRELPVALSNNAGAPMDWSSALGNHPTNVYYGEPKLSSTVPGSHASADFEAASFACQQPGGAQVGDNVEFRLVLDGMPSATTATFQSGTPLDQTVTLTASITPSAGAHVYDIQYRVNQGTPLCIFNGQVNLRLLR